MRKDKLSPRGLEIEFEGGPVEEVTAQGLPQFCGDQAACLEVELTLD